METAKLLGELMQAAYNCRKHDVFVDYSPHVNLVSIQIYKNGWTKYANSTETHRINLDEGMADRKLKELTKYINHLSNITETQRDTSSTETVF